MPVEKRYMAKKTVCKISFRLPQEIEAQSAHVVGDFNQWDTQATPMTLLKRGEWKADIKVEAGQEYRYRYLVNGQEWHNDWDIEKYVPNPYGQEDSVVIT